MANALLMVSHKTRIKINQKYLEKGYTQMECDSIHKNIVKKMRNREIYSSAGYVEICKTARIKPQPNKVQQFDHTFFKRDNDLNLISSVRRGSRSMHHFFITILFARHTSLVNLFFYNGLYRLFSGSTEDTDFIYFYLIHLCFNTI